MPTQDERKAAQAKLDELQPRIRELKQQLNQLNDQKEKAFEQRNPVGKEISQHIGRIKQFKHERDQFTDEVKKLKEQRSLLNDQIKAKISEAKKLNEEKKKTTTKAPVARESPAYLKRQIEHLETRIETDVIPFEKEKAIMKEIKELKKRHDAIKHTHEVWGESHHVSKEIDALRTQADAVHHQIQDKAKLSQTRHAQLMSESGTIDTLRGKGSTFTKDITEKKGEMHKLSDELNALQKQAVELRAQIGDERKEHAATEGQQRAKKFSEKLAEVKAKMKSGGKLTTEDIIILQGEN